MTKYSLHDDGLVILLFHGVIEKHTTQVRNYNRKHIEKSYFRSLLEDLKSAGTALSMDEVVQLHDRGNGYPKRSFAITFDDGFENNFSVAAPILQELGLPATFYATSGFIEHNGMSWIDKIEICLEEIASGSLLLPWQEDAVVFNTVEQRISLLSQIRSHVKETPGFDTTSLIEGICEQLGQAVVHSSNHPLDRKMSWAQLKTLSEDPLFIVGGHSHSHPILSFLTQERLEYEISTSVKLLSERAGIESIHYAYPEGLAHCYNDQVIAQLRKHGIRCSPSAISGINTPEVDLFNLRRVLVT